MRLRQAYQRTRQLSIWVIDFLMPKMNVAIYDSKEKRRNFKKK